MLPKNLLTPVNRWRYSGHIAETAATGFGDLRMLADNRRSAVFLRPYAFARPYDQRVGLGGETLGSAGANVPVRQPRSVPAHPFGDGERAFNINVGGRTMLRRILARSEQTLPPNILTQRYPLFELAGRNAAELWLVGSLNLSMADWRDLRFYQLTRMDSSSAGDVARREAFNDAFAAEIGNSIAQQSRAKANHG
ncbi:hypothetical protein PQR64_24000 [Paraburkholderia phytofirmans]|uniref:hypothetical protein n=1 Tax=Paraburkholderia phytofirmans TaxID=261302 RepID=UPI0038B72E8C